MAGEQSGKIAHPGFGGIEGAAILLAHPAIYAPANDYKMMPYLMVFILSCVELA